MIKIHPPAPFKGGIACFPFFPIESTFTMNKL